MNDYQHIITDGPAREMFYRGLILDTPLAAIAEEMHDLYGRHLFGDELAFIDCEVGRFEHFHGCYSWDDGDGARRRIRLDRDVFDCYEDFREVLVHEMCHQYVREVHLDWTPEESHGALFNAIAARVGIEPGDDDEDAALAGAKS